MLINKLGFKDIGFVEWSKICNMLLHDMQDTNRSYTMSMLYITLVNLMFEVKPDAM